MKLAIAGASGLVGSRLIQVLEEMDFPYDELIPIASARSLGKTIICKNRQWKILDIETALQKEPHIIIFSAGGELSRIYAPQFANQKCWVIDNSSTFRLDENVPLVVPEINAHEITKESYLIANPNCSTIQMVLPISGLHRTWGIRRLVISTYQAVSGSGYLALDQLMQERNQKEVEKIYPHPIDLNLFPHGGSFDSDGNTSEELKLLNETRKILNDYTIGVSSTVVRVPIANAHSMSVNIEFKQEFDLKQLTQIISQTPGVIVLDEPEKNIYPTPLVAVNKNEVFVGRIRRDLSNPNSVNIWIVADNLRKGAATNAIQIAQYLLKNDLLKL